MLQTEKVSPLQRPNRLAVRIKSFLIIILLLLFSARFGQAAEKLPLATGEWQPFTSAELEGYGFFTQIITAAFEEAGVAVDYRFFPWKRCEAYVESGKSFAAFPYSITDNRKTFAYFSDPVSEATTVFFFNKEKHVTPIHYDSMEDLKNYDLVGVLGYFYAETFTKKQLKVAYVRSEVKALELIVHKRYDLLPLNNFVGWNLINTRFPSAAHRFDTLKTPLSTDTLHLMVSRKYPRGRQLLNRFNAALRRIKAKGIYHRIMSTYSPP
jgi:polar amino acid transport system substrate-binding protein